MLMTRGIWSTLRKPGPKNVNTDLQVKRWSNELACPRTVTYIPVSQPTAIRDFPLVAVVR